MMIPGGAGITTTAAPAAPVRPYGAQAAFAPAQAQKGDLAAARRFDRVTLSGDNSYERALRGRLSQEVRRPVSAETVAALREQVRSGAYQIDPIEIARKMLLAGEAL